MFSCGHHICIRCVGGCIRNHTNGRNQSGNNLPLPPYDPDNPDNYPYESLGIDDFTREEQEWLKRQEG